MSAFKLLLTFGTTGSVSGVLLLCLLLSVDGDKNAFTINLISIMKIIDMPVTGKNNFYIDFSQLKQICNILM